jgi:hypothetical protein
MTSLGRPPTRGFLILAPSKGRPRSIWKQWIFTSIWRLWWVGFYWTTMKLAKKFSCN